MGIGMIDYFKKIIKQNKIVLLLLAGVCVLGYGFSITHYTIGIDDTNADYYLDGLGQIAHGRMTGPFLDKVLFPMESTPFWSLAIGIVLLYCASVVLTMLFSKVSGGKLSQGALIIFGTVLVSFPIINEILIYGHISYNANYLIVALALYFTYSIFEKFSFKKAILPIALMIFSVSYNESFCAVYLLGIIMTLILRFVAYKDKPLTFKKAAVYLIIGIGVLASAIIVEKIIEIIVLAILKPDVVSGADKAIMWKYYPFLSNLKLLIIGVIYRFFLAGTWYFPITIFAIAFCIAIITAIVLSIKRGSWMILLLFLGLLLAVFALSIIKGEAAPYRTSSTFGIFAGFIFMLLFFLLKGKWLKIAYGTLMVILVLNQTRVLNNWFVNDYQRYEHDKEVLLNIAEEIETNFDENKPIVFVGSIALAPQIKKVDINGTSFVNWGVGGGSVPGAANIEFLKQLGHEFNIPTSEQMDEGRTVAETMTAAYPKAGYVMETDDIIVVNLGNNYNYQDYICDKEKKVYDEYVIFLTKAFGWDADYALGQLETAIN